MEKYRITKYNPEFRNEKGHYLYDHWTETLDVGKVLEGELVTKEEYLRVEKDYINAVLGILKDCNQEYLRLINFHKDSFRHSLEINAKEWFHESEFEELDLYEDKKVSLEEIPSIVKLNLRSYFFTSLEIAGKFYFQFGYDFYMYVGCPKLSPARIKDLNSTSLFVDEGYFSPYYSEEIEYVILISEKNSGDVLEEEVLKSISVLEMKKIFNLSEEHPGLVLIELTKEMADKIGIETNFSEYEYSLRTNLVYR